MAITITTNSPIPATSGTHYINADTFEPKLFFTDTVASYNYILLRKDSDATRVVSNGKLQGFGSSPYKYRFDFSNYIKIDNQEDIVFENFDQVGSVKFSGNNSSTLYLCIDTVDLLAANILSGVLTSEINGMIKVATGHTVAEIVCDQMLEYKFWDKKEETLIMFESNPVVDFNKYFVVTMYGGHLYYNYYTSSNSVACASPMMTKASGYDYTVYMLRIPANTLWLGLQGYDNENHQIIGGNITAQCYDYTNYYFWNPNGTFDSLHCKGTDNIIETISKKNIQIGNKAVYNDITILKQIKQNSGFSLTQEQIYGLLESPSVVSMIEAGDEVNNVSLIDDISTWDTTGNWTYSTTTHVWSANDNAYDYLMSPVINTADHGFTYTIRFDASISDINQYKIEIQDFDAVETVYASFVGYGSNQFTFTCDPSVDNFKVFFFGIDANSNICEIWNFTMDAGTLIKADTTKNPYKNVNLLADSLVDITSDTYGFGNLPITLMAGQQYTFSANGYISEASYNAGEYLQILVYRASGGWATAIQIYSGIPTTKSVTFTVPTTELYNVAAYPSVNPGQEVHFEWAKIELGATATPWTLSIDEYLPVAKQYNVETTTFEGYNGVKLGEKNRELIFTDPKVYKRKTNRNITFFD